MSLRISSYLAEPKLPFLAQNTKKSKFLSQNGSASKDRRKRCEFGICTARSAGRELSSLPIAHEVDSEILRRVLYCNKQGTCTASSEGTVSVPPTVLF